MRCFPPVKEDETTRQKVSRERIRPGWHCCLFLEYIMQSFSTLPTQCIVLLELWFLQTCTKCHVKDFAWPIGCFKVKLDIINSYVVTKRLIYRNMNSKYFREGCELPFQVTTRELLVMNSSLSRCYAFAAVFSQCHLFVAEWWSFDGFCWNWCITIPTSEIVEEL